MRGDFWFNGWTSVGRIAIFAVLAYVLFIVLVRVLGKRTISKRNPSDFVMTVALGSIVGNWVMQSPISIVDGVTGLTVVMVLQYVNEYLTTRSETLRSLTEGQPKLLLYDGKPCWENMKREQINEHELLLSLRHEGYNRMEDAGAVVLEIDGTVSVLPRDQKSKPDLLRDVVMRA